MILKITTISALETETKPKQRRKNIKQHYCIKNITNLKTSLTSTLTEVRYVLHHPSFTTLSQLTTL